MIIRDSEYNTNTLQVSNCGALLADGLENFISELNYLGGMLYQDTKSKRVFEIREIDEDERFK